ncbi:alcohol oxidase [Amylostereum chailletii]|nr:alcohol oxidase [Amylostereum chailletii]
MFAPLFVPVFLLLGRLSSCKVFTDPAQLQNSQYDFVVIGGGTAGNVVASRLSENASVSVLIIEAGSNDEGIEELQIPFTASGVLTNVSLIWNYTTVPQNALGRRSLPYTRGRVLGGSSSINLLFFTRGSRDDFDRFANVTGDEGWSWSKMFPFMLKAETFTPPVDHRNITGEFNASVHGTNGPLLTTLSASPGDFDAPNLETTQVDPGQFPFNLDSNSGDTIGLSWIQSTSGNGIRSSSATAYLHPALGRQNLDLLLNTQVTRILPTNHQSSSVPDLRVVEFARNSSCERFTVRASNEVILSAGPVNTPQLLLLSGIGNPQHLKSMEIPILVNLPGVGQNLQDHPLMASQWHANPNDTLDDITRNATLAADLLDQWETTRTGIFAGVGAGQFIWSRLAANSSIFGEVGDPSAGPTSAHFEIVPGNLFVSYTDPTPANGTFASAALGVSSPLSRGSITLKSSDPFDSPNIDPAFFESPVDVSVMVQALRTAEAFYSSKPFEGIVFQSLLNGTTDEELAAYARAHVTSFWHTCCTASMGREGDDKTVVGPDLRLVGARGLRVVDASVFPFIPAAHLQAPVDAIAERAARIIQGDWSI